MAIDIVQEIMAKVAVNTVIPKPEARADFLVKGWGKRRNEPALVYKIPNHKNPNKPHEKGITVSEWRQAYQQICDGEDFDRQWFNENMSNCASEGGCNFTTIGGIFQLLGLVDYQRGAYTPRK